MPGSAPYEVITGPAQTWIAPLGTAFPPPGGAPAVAWIDLGWTDGGVRINPTQNIEQYRVDQIQGPIKAQRTEEALTIGMSIVQLTLERWAYVLGVAAPEAVAAVAGPPAIPAHKKIKLQRGPDIALFAFLVRGPSPYGPYYADWDVPMVFQSGDPESTYTRDGMQSLTNEWTALADTSKPAGDQFGDYLAITA